MICCFAHRTFAISGKLCAQLYLCLFATVGSCMNSMVVACHLQYQYIHTQTSRSQYTLRRRVFWRWRHGMFIKAAAATAAPQPVAIVVFVRTTTVSQCASSLYDNRILWTSFQSRTRRAVIKLCTVDGLTAFVRLTKKIELYVKKNNKRILL